MRVLFLLAFLLLGCQQEMSATDAQAPVVPTVSSGETTNVVEVVTRNMAFHAPDEIPSGWTTIRLENEGEVAHFALLNHLPDGYGLEDQMAEVVPIFVEGAELLYAGENEAAMEVFGRFPQWYLEEAVYVGGPGLLSPGLSTDLTLKLEPGTYVLECYVKTNGAFHPMAHELTVTGEANEARPPTPTHAITVSSERGIEADAEVEAGTHTFAVHYEDQTTYEHFLGHDVHLARLDEEADLDALNAWMDWSKREGLETPTPAPFLGGAHEMPAGETSYFTTTLEPGRYAWVAEVPDPAGKGMLKTFTVRDATDS